MFSQVLINEFSSSNISSIPDEDGDYDDWIELYNNSPSKINLGGYHLSDDPSFLKKWTLPSVSIKSHSFLFVYASGKNRTTMPINYKTIIYKNDLWQYLVPSSEPDISWKKPGFNASGWQSGPAGFGFGDDDDSTKLDKIKSVYIRKEFTLSNIEDIAQVVLSVDYDDGFVAYINGHEIARSNVGTAASVPYNYLTGTSKEAVMYAGGTPGNFFSNDPAGFLAEGTNVIAIQGHNSSATSSDFSLIPVLTIGRIAAGIKDSIPSYIKLNGRKLHTNFKIDAEGETLVFSAPDTSVLDVVNPVRLTNDLSYGRLPDGSSSWFYFDNPTPCAPNTSKGYTSLMIDTVIFSAKGGYYPYGLQLSLSSLFHSDSVFYTLDGSEPTKTSLRYSTPLTISDNSVVRARSIKSGMMPGPVFTNTYFTRKHTFPVVCISTDPPNLWDYYTGIYVMGPNASTTNPYYGANFWQDWERRAHMELYDVSGMKCIDQDVGLKIYGAWSRAKPQKSLALYARKEYGKGSFDYRFFKDKPIESFESVVLRNGGNDWGKAFFRDAITSTLVKDMDIDRTAVQPAILYLNGEYWGILELREKISNNYLAENYPVSPLNVNLLVSNSTIIDGTNASYTDITEYLNDNTLETDAKYRFVTDRIDINNYIQYQLTEIFIDNKDWPGNNIKFWNSNNPGSLWRWIIYDTDFGYSLSSATAYTYNTLAWALTPDSQTGGNKPWATLLFRRMITNPGFRNEFATQYADRMNRNFSAQRISTVTDSLKQLYSPEINDHLTRWNLSYTSWTNSIANIKGFASNRQSNARAHLISAFNLGPPTEVKIQIANPGTGKVRINSIIPYSFPFTGVYFKDLPVQLTALPAPGYKFYRWEMGTTISGSPTMTYDMSGPRNFRALFVAARNTDNKLVINEISYNSAPGKDAEDWVEIYNSGKSTVNLKNWIISDGGPVSGFKIPSDLVLYPGMYAVICHDLAAFNTYWKQVRNSTGNMEFGLSSSGEKISLFSPDGILADFVDYKVESPWPFNVPEGGSIELTDPLSDNNDGRNWRSSTTGTPGQKNFYAKEITGTVITENGLSCYPNPFRDFTTFWVEIAETGRYRLEIFNAMGKLVSILADRIFEPGEYYFDWHGENSIGSALPAGVFTVRLSGSNRNKVIRVVSLK